VNIVLVSKSRGIRKKFLEMMRMSRLKRLLKKENMEE
jgi:hypothetical protein